MVHPQVFQFLFQSVNQIRFRGAVEIGFLEGATWVVEQILYTALEHRIGRADSVVPVDIAVH